MAVVGTIGLSGERSGSWPAVASSLRDQGPGPEVELCVERESTDHQLRVDEAGDDAIARRGLLDIELQRDVLNREPVAECRNGPTRDRQREGQMVQAGRAIGGEQSRDIAQAK